MDETTQHGYSPKNVADRILTSVLRGDKEVTIASFTQKIAILLRSLNPNLYFWVMQNRAKRLLKAK